MDKTRPLVKNKVRSELGTVKSANGGSNPNTKIINTNTNQIYINDPNTHPPLNFSPTSRQPRTTKLKVNIE